MANQKCIELEDVDQNLGCNGGNAGGISTRVIYGYWDDVAAWPDEPAPASPTVPLPLDEAGALVGDLVMKPGTRAFYFDMTEDAGNFTVTTEGEVDGMSVIYTLNIVKAKLSKTVFGFINAALNRKMFFIVQDMNDVEYLMGGKKRGCSYVPGGDGAVTGTAASDRNQTTLQFTYRAGKALVYEGETEGLLTLVPVTP
ncbi:hypothetical protein [Dysgonomonas termitidis]|uniref:Uncharacterized protein n=1 Tax=Dysgonomonas termitidis TaxID=1516126 RepID=A0ABV9KV47_9BACT